MNSWVRADVIVMVGPMKTVVVIAKSLVAPYIRSGRMVLGYENHKSKKMHVMESDGSMSEKRVVVAFKRGKKPDSKQEDLFAFRREPEPCPRCGNMYDHRYPCTDAALPPPSRFGSSGVEGLHKRIEGLSKKAKSALDVMLAGGYYKEMLEPGYHGGEKWKHRLRGPTGGVMRGYGFKTYHELSEVPGLFDHVPSRNTSVSREHPLHPDAKRAIEEYRRDAKMR